MPAIIIPENTVGKAIDLQSVFTASSEEAALHHYLLAVSRLKNVHLWHELSGKLSAEFQLVANDGAKVKRPVEQGDYCMIDIPGPGMREGFGYDWVSVEKLSESTNESETAFTLLQFIVSENPATPGEETAHFFQKGATSTFVIERKGLQVIASYHGRNEVPNTDVHRITDKIRNASVAFGSYAGLSELQWQTLIDSFLNGGPEETKA